MYTNRHIDRHNQRSHNFHFKTLVMNFKNRNKNETLVVDQIQYKINSFINSS